MKISIGDRVVIKSGPWVGHSGVVTAEMNTPVGFMWRVNLDNGMASGVRPENLSRSEGEQP